MTNFDRDDLYEQALDYLADEGVDDPTQDQVEEAVQMIYEHYMDHAMRYYGQNGD
jgi:hypothetical protein